MPIPGNQRTAQVINNEINGIVKDKDASATLSRDKLVVLTLEYDRAVGREAAQRKLKAMSRIEVEEFKILIEEGS